LSERARAPGATRMEIIRESAKEVTRPIVFAVGIIILVYVPILMLGGVEGKMFKPMAATVLFALAASLIVALTLMPVLSWFAFGKTAPNKSDKETWLMRHVRRVYEPALQRTMRFPKTTLGVAAVIFVASLAAIPFLGAEFIPRLDEGSLLIQMYRVPGISLPESLHGNEIIESVLREFPEVRNVVTRTGTPEIATDPMSLEQSDVYAHRPVLRNRHTARPHLRRFPRLPDP